MRGHRENRGCGLQCGWCLVVVGVITAIFTMTYVRCLLLTEDELQLTQTTFWIFPDTLLDLHSEVWPIRSHYALWSP